VKLYELPALFRRIVEALDDSGGEVDEGVASLLALAEETLSEKVDCIASLIREKLARAEAERKEAEHFAARARADANSAENLKRYLMECLAASGLDGAKGRRFSAAIRRNGVPTIRWESGEEPPAEFTRTVASLDLRAAQEAYRAGTLPDGFVVSFGRHLRLR
jgi:hypothetical protein